MSKIRSKILAASAALTLLGSAGLAGALTAAPASAGTPSCGTSCINVYPQVYAGATTASPGFVVDVLRQGEKVGQPVILFRTANYDPAEDWSLAFDGQVSDFYAAGLVSSAVDLHYGGQCEQTVSTTGTGVLSAPAAPAVATAPTGGTVAAGTYYVEVTYVNANGQTVASGSSSVVTTGSTSTITITSPASVTGATGWYAYVATTSGGPYYRQQASGSPTAIGTAYVLTAPPTAREAAFPPFVNTATVPVQACGQYYPDDNAWENEYAPFGVDSGLCMGVASIAFQGEGVTLQACGVSARTVWIEDTADSSAAGYYVAINGSDTNFSDPFVLTYPSDAYPTDKPRPQLTVTNLTGFSSGPADNDDQLWTGFKGILP